MPPKVTLFVVAKNEIEGMKLIMPQIDRSLFAQILIGDGQSQDGSAEWCKEQGFEVYVQKQVGIRHVYQEAWPLIRGDYVITFSPDCNCKPEDLPLLVGKLAQGYDMVIASRYFQDAKSEDDGLVTAFGNWLFTALINLFFRGHYTDAMTIYRGYRTSLFYELDLHKEESYLPEKPLRTVMGIEPLLSIRAAKQKIKFLDIPSDEPLRAVGARKLQVIKWGAAYLLQVFREIYFWRASKY